MSIWTDLAGRWIRRSETTEVAVRESDDRTEVLYEQLHDMAERLLELEREDVGWQPIVRESQQDFSRDYLRRIVDRSRNAYLYHPLINRSIGVKVLYVWGQGVTFKAADPDVNAVIQAFLDDKDNRAELTSHAAQEQREVDLETDGNLFFALFPNPSTGHVKVRSIPIDEIEDIITNPEDRRDIWFYKRKREGSVFDLRQGKYVRQSEITYHPDWLYQPEPGARITTIDDKRVVWDTPVYHVKVGGLGSMKFGVPELYAALDWNLADTTFRQDFAAVARTLQRFAAQMKVEKGGKQAIASAKAKLNSAFAAAGGSTSAAETNPAPNAGAVFIGGTGTTFDPVKVGGATLNLGDVRYLTHMVCAAAGLPEYFYGNADVGNYATSKTLDRPTELNFQNRRMLWTSVFSDIFDFCIDKSVIAAGGYLSNKGSEVENEITGEMDIVLDDERDRSVMIDFPSILEHSITEQVDAIVKASTLGGVQPIGTMDHRTLIKLLLTALGVQEIDELLEVLAPEDGPSLIDKLKDQAAQQAQDLVKAQKPEPPANDNGNAPNGPDEPEPSPPPGGGNAAEDEEESANGGQDEGDELEEHGSHNQKAHGRRTARGTSGDRLANNTAVRIGGNTLRIVGQDDNAYKMRMKDGQTLSITKKEMSSLFIGAGGVAYSQGKHHDALVAKVKAQTVQPLPPSPKAPKSPKPPAGTPKPSSGPIKTTKIDKTPSKGDTVPEVGAKGSTTKTKLKSELSTGERQMVSTYTGASYYSINKGLRNPPPGFGKEITDPLDNALKKSVLAKDTTLLRGMSLTPDQVKQFKPGKAFIDKGYVSTTTSAKVMESFSHGTGTSAVHLQITAKAGKNALDVKPFSQHKGEAEVLLPRGSKFKITSVKEPGPGGGPYVVKAQLM